MDLTTFNFGIAIALFFIYFMLDAINSYFTIKVIQMSPIHAASAGCTMHFFIALGVMCYVNNFLYLIPMMLGSFAGIYTLLTVRRLLVKEKIRDEIIEDLKDEEIIDEIADEMADEIRTEIHSASADD